MSAAEELHLAAVLAQLNGGRPGAAAWKAWDLGDLADLEVKPTERIEVSVTRRYIGEGRRVSADQDFDGWRIDTFVVANDSTNARTLRAHVRTRLEKAVLTIGGVATTPVMFEAGAPIMPDDQKFYSGSETWTYTH